MLLARLAVLQVAEDMEAHAIQPYPRRDGNDDKEDILAADEIRAQLPFAVIGHNYENTENGATVRGRRTKFGFINGG
jgi:septin 3/9/12